MSAQAKLKLTAQDYLALERQATEKSEFVAGEMFLMAGASQAHNRITSNINGELYAQFKNRPCQVFTNDMRVHLNTQGNYVYPDVLALCAEPEFDDAQQDNLLNPVLIIEVLSDSTEAYDRGRKFELYRQLATVKEYVLVAQNRCHVEQYQRQATGQWVLTEFNDLAAELQLVSVNANLYLAAVYAKVKFATNGTIN